MQANRICFLGVIGHNGGKQHKSLKGFYQRNHFPPCLSGSGIEPLIRLKRLWVLQSFSKIKRMESRDGGKHASDQ